MAYTYPGTGPTVVGDNVQVSKFLNSPTLVQRRVNELANQRYVTDVLLSGRTPDVTGGAVQYEVDEDNFTVREPESVSPGGEYPLTPISEAAPAVAKIQKIGQDTILTDEKIKRSGMNEVERGFNKLVNSNVRKTDSIGLSLIGSAVSATHAAAAPWDDTGAAVLRDILLAKAKVTALDKGYDPNVIVVNDEVFALLASDTQLAAFYAREDRSNPAYTGSFPIVGGLQVLPTNFLPAGAEALIADTNFLGGIAFEDLGGNYQGSAATGVETKSIRDELNDQWRLRARRPLAHFVTDPGAAIKLTGITA
ncbi:MAG: phage major capsid protein [Brachybacterium tyrofermentans]|uniref:phage major capsid protein n=1 Tax=Brachybacterium tyrofermentans TaxID=47848 RepID=UPI000A1A52F2|nr:Phage protein [Corynebacterium xerosis]